MTTCLFLLLVSPATAGTILTKYSPDGEQLWVVADDSREGDPEATVFLDPYGDVFVHQLDYVAKYDSEGVELWRYDAEFFQTAMDSEGSLYLPCGRHCIGKRDRDGVALWKRNLGQRIPYAMVADAWDNLLLFTYSDNASEQIIKFTPDGELLWTFDFYASGDVDAGTNIGSLCVDNQGDFYFYAVRQGQGGIARFDSEARLVWRAEFPDLFPEFIALDTERNIFVASEGEYNGNLLPGASFAVAKTDSNGQRVWTKFHDWWPGSDYGSSVEGVSVTPDGGFAAVGFAGGWATIVYAPNGEELWAAQLSNTEAVPQAMTVDQDGNVISVGYSCTCGKEDLACCEMVIAKYSADGTMEWGTTYDHPADDRDQASGVATDEEGNIYVVGRYGYPDDDLDEETGCGC